MDLTTVTTFYFNLIADWLSVEALTIQQKYEALRNIGQGSFSGLLTNKWFILTAASMVFILTAMLVVIGRLNLSRKITVSAGPADMKTELSAAGAETANRLISSRHIPVGAVVSIATAAAADGGPGRIDAVVMENGHAGLTVRLQQPLSDDTIENRWNVHYRIGAMTWTFDTLSLKHRENTLMLSHCDRPRFVSRRRFLRVPVKKPALVAHFPVVRCGFEDSMLPDFTKAELTEMGGCGIRIEADIEVSRGDRLQVIFELEPGRLLEDIGIVRGYRDGALCRSIGLELVGLNNAAINELIGTANRHAAAMRIQQLPAGHGEELVRT